MTLKSCTPNELRTRLREGVVQFAFKKLNGELRTVVGTTNLATIPLVSHPKGVRESPPSVVCFFDLEKGEWRSLSIRAEVFVNS
jgi:hypothetical protein